MVSLSTALTVAFLATVVASEDPSSPIAHDCRILKGESNLCPSVHYSTDIKNVADADSCVQEYLDEVFSSLDTPISPKCATALQEAFCLLQFPKCQGQTQKILPVCWSVRDYVIKACHMSFKDMDAPHTDSRDLNSQGQMSDSLFFGSMLESRWASSSIQEPNCVSIHGHGDLAGDSKVQAHSRAGEEHWMKEQSATESNTDQEGLFEFHSDEDIVSPNMEQKQDEAVKATLKARHLSRRERVKHHHHQSPHQQDRHNTQRHHHHHKLKRDTPEVAIRADIPSGQSIYTVGGSVDNDNNALHEPSSHARTTMEGNQKVLIQGGSGPADPSAAVDALGKASSGQPSKNTKADETVADGQGKAGGAPKEALWIAAAPILLLMGAIAGFTAYRRFYESKGLIDSTDYPDTCNYRDLPIRQGSPIHFDRTFQNADHSPRPTATYHYDPESSGRIRHSSSTSSMTTKRPPPSAGSLGRKRYQILSRSYDLRAGIQSIKNALTRSNNNSHDSALNQASSHSGTNPGFQTSMSADHVFGAGGHPIAKLGSHPGLNVSEKHQVQRQCNAGSTRSKFPDRIITSGSQEQSIVWGRSTEDSQSRKSPSSASLSMLSGKYSHHHQQMPRQHYDIDSELGDYLAPESPSTTREEEMRRRSLLSGGYSFRREEFIVDDDHSGTNLLFDTSDCSGSEMIHDTDLCEDEVNMYLSMEKEESPEILDTSKSVMFKSDESIQKTAVLSEKDAYLTQPSLDRKDETIHENKALQVLKAMDVEAAAAPQLDEPELETPHVLGSASPEGSPRNIIDRERHQAVDNNRGQDTIGAAGTSSHPQATHGQPNRQHTGSQNKKKGNKGRKGRK